jgi:argininosuccinate lyase
MSQKSHLWSGRFSEAPNTEVFDFQASFGFDNQLFEDDVEGSLAWAEALASAGVLTRDDAVVIRQALIEIREDARLDPDFLTGSDEDVHAFVERQLIARVGDVGRRLHTGRSRNEQVSLDLRLYLRRRLLVVQDKIVNFVAALAARAESAGHAVMPAYTHLRRAQPVLVAHFFLAHAVAFRRDYGRLNTARDEADALPMGSGAVVGTSYDINPEALAARLGFSRVVANSVDAAADRDFVSAALHGYSLIMVHLSRLAEDLIIFTGEEFDYFELADAVSTGSSLMPQKKNPDALELIRGKTGRVLGHHFGWLTTMKGLPSGYNKDLQEDKEALFDAERTALNSLHAATIVVNTLELREKQAETAASGMLLATDVADYLVKRGLPFRTAHEVVGGIVRELVDRGQDFEALTLNEWRAYHELFGDDIVDQISTRGSIEARQTPQSTNPDAVTRSLAELRAWLRRTGTAPSR